MIGYAFLGTCWLNWKTEGGLQRQAVTYATRLGILLLAVVGAVSLATLSLKASHLDRWRAWPVCSPPRRRRWRYRSLSRRKDAQPSSGRAGQ